MNTVRYLPLLTSLSLGCALVPTVGAQRPRLLKDINTQRPAALSSLPAAFVQAGSRVLFTAKTEATDSEVFSSDGTAAGTYVVADGPGTTFPQELLSLGSVAVWSRFDGSRRQLWRSDGLPSGTGPVDVGSNLDEVQGLARLGSRVLFSARSAGTGVELYVSDGTAAGTALVRDIVPGVDSSHPRPLVALGNRVLFVANVGASSFEVWSTDGTTAGTSRVQTLAAALSPQSRFFGESMGSRALITTGSQIYISDGSAAGTRRLATGFVMGATEKFACYLETQNTDRLLWRDDGNGTRVQLAKIGAGFPPNSTESIEHGGALLFPFELGQGRQLYRVDENSTAPEQVTPTTGVASIPRSLFLTTFQGRVYFSGGDNTLAGVELWSTDGTQAGTQTIGDVFLGENSFYPASLTAIHGRLWFSGISAAGTEPWISDGTLSGTRMIADLNASTVQNEGSIVAGATFVGGYGGTLFASQVPPAIWRTDGTTAGTQKIADQSFGFRIPPTEALGKIFFAGSNQSVGTELFATDGTPQGTQLIADIYPGGFNGILSTTLPVEHNGLLLFAARGTTAGIELWRSDGTGAGTTLVRDIVPGPLSSSPSGFVSLGASVYFFTGGARVDTELWRTDGTTTGTVRVSGIPAGHRLSMRPTLVGADQIQFGTADAAGLYLWRTDGTNAGTQQIAVLGPARSFGDIVAANDRGCFATVYESVSERFVLWFSEGTAASTRRLQSTALAQFPPDFQIGEVLGQRLVYRFDSAAAGSELHSSDGTVGGTGRLVDLEPGSASSNPRSFVAAGDRSLWFVADIQGEPRLCRTDGSAGGTIALPGSYDVLGPMHVSNGKLFFAAKDAFIGGEPHVLDLSAVSIPFGHGCGERENARLQISDPVIGQSHTLRLSGAVPNRAGLLLLGAKVPSMSALTQLSRDCLALIDLSQPLVSLPIGTDSNGVASRDLRIPFLPSLAGLNLVAQTAVGPTQGSLGLDLSGALDLFVGY